MGRIQQGPNKVEQMWWGRRNWEWERHTGERCMHREMRCVCTGETQPGPRTSPASGTRMVVHSQNNAQDTQYGAAHLRVAREVEEQHPNNLIQPWQNGSMASCWTITICNLELRHTWSGGSDELDWPVSIFSLRTQPNNP